MAAHGQNDGVLSSGAGALAFALQQAQARLAALSEVSLQGVIAHRRFAPVHANDAAAAMLGYPDAAAVLARPSLLEHFDLDVRLDPERAWRQAAGGPASLTRLSLRRLDGAFAAVDALTSAVRWDGETTVLMALIDVDRQERAVRAAAEAAERAAAADRARRRLLDAVSHELRTPLHLAMGRLQLLLQRAETDDLAIGAMSACRRLQRRLDDLIAAAAEEAEAVPVPPEPFCLRETLEAAIDQFCDEDAARPPVHLEGAGLARLGRPQDVRRLVLALLTEAAARHPAAPLVVSAIAEPAGVNIRVALAGGLAPARPAPADALPLNAVATARRLAHAMGGVIGVRDAPGAAWEAEAFLPLPAAASARRESPSAGPLDILVVDDHAGNRQLLAQVLRVMGHAPTLADSGGAALALAAERAFDVVIMDLAMPDLDGFETARRLRAGPYPWAATAPIIALTANGAPTAQEHAAEAGMDGFLTKPLDLRRLAAALALLGRARGSVGPAELDEIKGQNQPDETENDRQRRHA